MTPNQLIKIDGKIMAIAFMVNMQHLFYRKDIFEELGMHRTRDRNGVLIYLSVADRKLAVIGDEAINQQVPENFWNDVLGLLKLHLAAGRPAHGLVEAVHMVGEKLRIHFPLKHDDTDELPNEVSFGRR